MTFSEQVIEYFRTLRFDLQLPDGIEAMNPYRKEATMEAVSKYYSKFYNDCNPRTFIVGINPGRFGSGVTGISFTDTVRLENDCKIAHSVQPTTELSSEYIYKVVKAMGGAGVFFSQYYLTALSPIGFTKDGKNYNYYDSSAMVKATLPYMKEQIGKQIAFGANRKVAFSLGAGQNYKYLKLINEQLGYPFERIEAINHPRFVMQYRRKSIDLEIEAFINAIRNNR